MISRTSSQNRLLIAGLVASLGLTTPELARSQEKPAPNVQLTPTTVPGRPDIPNAEIAKTLRGVPQPPFATPAEKLQIGQLKTPKGFKLEVYASGIANARSLRIGDKGTVFVSNRQLDKVYAIVERNGKREIKVIASGLDRPNGLAFIAARSTSAKGPKFPSWKGSKTVSTTRANPSSSTGTYRINNRTAGSLSPSARTTSST